MIKKTISDEYGKWIELRIGQVLTLKRNHERVFEVIGFKEIDGEPWVRLKWFSAMEDTLYAYSLKQIKDEFRLSNIKEKHQVGLVTNSIEFICNLGEII